VDIVSVIGIVPKAYTEEVLARRQLRMSKMLGKPGVRYCRHGITSQIIILIVDDGELVKVRFTLTDFEEWVPRCFIRFPGEY